MDRRVLTDAAFYVVVGAIAAIAGGWGWAGAAGVTLLPIPACLRLCDAALRSRHITADHRAKAWELRLKSSVIPTVAVVLALLTKSLKSESDATVLLLISSVASVAMWTLLVEAFVLWARYKNFHEDGDFPSAD
jgi:hypothetical protein